MNLLCSKSLDRANNESSSDQSYRAASKEPARQEVRLLQIQLQLNSWHSLIPQCVTTTYTTDKYSFRNNCEFEPTLCFEGVAPV